MNITRMVIAVCCALMSPVVTGAVIHVPADQPDIQAGIDAAADGDTVLVADGTWYGAGLWQLDFSGKAITVRSENGPQACVISGYSGSGFLFLNGEGAGSVVEGFTITEGNASKGGAIRCENSSPTIRNNIISGNRGIDGGGIYCHSSSPIIIGNIISDNDADNYGLTDDGGYGGGIYCTTGSNPVIADNLIYGNSAMASDYSSDGGVGGGIYCFASSPLITNNLIAGNFAEYYGGGAYLSFGNPVLRHNTIIDNVASINGGGVQGQPVVSDCIIRGNSPNSISSLATVSYSDIEGGFSGTGNIDVDPLFVSGPEGDYYLSHLSAGDPANSPCIDTGSDLAQNLCYAAGSETVCMNAKTTHRDNRSDTSTVDMGFHHAWKSVYAELACVPGWGTLPFPSLIQTTLTNQYGEQARRVQYILEVTLAGGQYFNNWRRGYQNIQAGGVFFKQWSQEIPALPSLLGENLFALTAIDITPPPYNLPPYPPSGDTDQASYAVVGSHDTTFSPSIICTPATGTVPFTGEICIELRNNTDLHRQLAYQVARTRADGTYDPNFQQGYQNVAPHELFTRCWEESFPFDESSIGTNTYQLYAEDVTAPPYNQPPYPTAGDTGTAIGTVEGFSPPQITWYVDDDNCPGPGDGTPEDPFCTIRQGIDAAVDYDTVLVADGTYTGSGNYALDFGGKRITLRSMNGPQACIIDIQGSPTRLRRAFYFHSGEGPESVVRGFTVTRGYGLTSGGGGMLCSSASPTIADCRFIQNTTFYEWGGGISLRYSSARIVNCGFSDNSSTDNYAGSGGGGINCYHSSPTIADCAFTGNFAIGGENGEGGGIRIYGYDSVVTITNCLFTENEAYWRGGAVSISGGQASINNCTFVDNSCSGSGGDGGGIDISSDGPTLTVIDSILWGNTPNQIHAVSGDTVAWCDIEGGYPGTGNIDAAPLFIPGPSGDYYLAQTAAGQPADSPCLDAGSDLAANICFTTAAGVQCLDQYTTRTDQVSDAGEVDIGYHHPPVAVR